MSEDVVVEEDHTESLPDTKADLVTCADQVAQMQRERQHRQQGQGTQGLRTLIEKLASSRSVRYIQIRSGDNTLSMQA